MYKPKISISHDFLGQEYVTETTRNGNITVKRNFEVWRGQLWEHSLYLLYVM